MHPVKITAQVITAMKAAGSPIAALTAYDFPMAKLLDEAGIPLLLVGDSLGMVVLGYPDTVCVTMEEMEHHVRAVARAKPNALVVADLPFNSYSNAEEAVRNSKRLVDAGANAVKAEGGRDIKEQIHAILESGIPFLGHLGMLPQHVREEGGYHIKGRVDSERKALSEDAQFLANAGAFAIILELVTPPVALELTRQVSIPTIGIGSGPDCDGQILVTSDLVGLFPWFTPKFVKPHIQVAEQIRSTAANWKKSLAAKQPVSP